MIPSHSNHLLHSSPDFPPLSAFSSLSGLCSGGSSDPCLSPIPLPSTSSLSRPPMAVRHHQSIEAPDPVGTVRRFTPSTNVDALDAASSISPLFATLTENTGGGGTSFQPRNLHCHPRRLSLPPYFTSLPCLLFRFTHRHPQLQSLHALTSQFSVYALFAPPPSIHSSFPLRPPLRQP